MSNYLQKIVYLTEEQAQTLFSNGTITSGGKTITYDDNDLYITTDNYSVKVDTTANWNQKISFIPNLGDIIIYLDKTTINNTTIPGIKIGDGLTYCINLPFIDDNITTNLLAHINNTNIHITAEERQLWNNKLDNLDTLGDLAYKDSATGSYNTVESILVSTNTTTNKTAAVAPTSGTVTYTPEGSISGITWAGSSTTSTGKFTPQGSVATSNKTFAVTGSAVPQNGTANYTPNGDVSAPIISIATAGSTTSIKNPTSVTVIKTITAVAPETTAPANSITYYSVEDDTLKLYQLGYTTGDSITTSNVTVKTGDAEYSASTPTFTGIGTMLTTATIKEPTGTFNGTEGDISVTGTPNGSITNQGIFNGTGVRLVTENIPVPNSYTATITPGISSITVS